MAQEAENDVVFDSVEALSKARSQAESRVKLVRALAEDGEIETADLRGVQALYDDARADVNSGLDRLLVELEKTGSYESAEPYAEVAERAANRVDDFVRRCDAIILGDDRSGVIGGGLSLAETLVTALVDVWKTVREGRTDRHALFVERVESLKWGEFDDI